MPEAPIRPRDERTLAAVSHVLCAALPCTIGTVIAMDINGRYFIYSNTIDEDLRQALTRAIDAYLLTLDRK